MMEWIQAESAGHCLFEASLFCCLVLLIVFRGRRIEFLVPSLIISLIILNPWFYNIWTKLELYAYWRILWVVPVLPVVASMVPAVTEKAGKMWIKGVIAIIGIAAIMLGGTYLYGSKAGKFVKADNEEKLPGYVVEIAERILKQKERPRIIAQAPIGVYIRQYSGEINTLYGRDLYGYIQSTGEAVKVINSALDDSESDLGFVSQFMLDDDYDYLVMTERETNDFELVDTVAGYGIYRPLGSPTVIKGRNELGQITSITCVDENGNPISNEYGYSTTLYTYDEYGFLIRERRLDTEGNSFADSLGCVGFEWEYNRDGNRTMERYIDVNGDPVACNVGYAEFRREYNGSDIVRETYYDENGNLINRTDTGYAEIQTVYDENHNVVSEKHFDSNGNEI